MLEHDCPAASSTTANEKDPALGRVFIEDLIGVGQVFGLDGVLTELASLAFSAVQAKAEILVRANRTPSKPQRSFFMDISFCESNVYDPIRRSMVPFIFLLTRVPLVLVSSNCRRS